MNQLPTFIAIDFETANRDPRSACEIAVVRVVNGEIMETHCDKVKPPEVVRPFGDNGSVYLSEFTMIHGLDERMTEDAPEFKDLWPKYAPLFADAAFVVAHNVPFDRKVLAALLNHYVLPLPPNPWRCTLEEARRRFRGSRSLDVVCQHLGIEGLDHHQAESDAVAAAKIAIKFWGA